MTYFVLGGLVLSAQAPQSRKLVIMKQSLLSGLAEIICLTFRVASKGRLQSPHY